MQAELNIPTPLPIQPEELEMLQPRDRIGVADWALQKRKLSPKTTNLAGDWSHYYTPYAVEPMDSLSDIGTREITLMKCFQAAGTEIGLNFLGWIIDESPGPTLIVMPGEKDTNRRVGTRIKPMFESTPSLRRHLPRRNVDEINIGKETILDNMIMYLGWAGSAAALADNPICYVVLDEVGKYPHKSGKEADPVSLAKDRLRTFFARSKLYSPSTPVTAGDLIDREYKAGDQRKNWIKCPFCDQRHIPAWQYVDLDKDSARNLLSADDYLSGECARYICPHCEKRWTEQDRWLAVSAGIWAQRDCRVSPEGKIIGKVFSNPHRSYQVPAFLLYPGFMTMGRLGAKWAEAQVARKAGDVGPLQDFINGQLAEPFEEKEKETEESKLTPHIGTYKPEIVPAGAQILTAGIDVQLDHVWVRLLGWGYMSEVWSIFESRIETGDTSVLGNYEPLREFLSMTWPMFDGSAAMVIRKAAIDVGYRSDVVLDFCRLVTEVDLVPVRGDDTVRNRIWRAVKVAGGTMTRYDLNVNAIKDRLHRLLYEATVPGAGYFHLHSETTPEVLEHLSSEEEVIVRRGRRYTKFWQKKNQHKQNHLWDCDVYATFAAELAGARTLRDPNAPEPRNIRRIGRIQRFKR